LKTVVDMHELKQGNLEKPQAYGVFKPVGHVVVSFASAADAQGAAAALRDDGFTDDDVTAYAPQAMLAQADTDIDRAGPAAGLGQELNLVRAHRELAAKGYHFLVVRATSDERAQAIASTARRFNAERAQRYGRLIIEELIEPGNGEPQVAESPDRGLDSQTRSGHEGDNRSS
jgi:hypothetical protein